MDDLLFTVIAILVSALPGLAEPVLELGHGLWSRLWRPWHARRSALWRQAIGALGFTVVEEPELGQALHARAADVDLTLTRYRRGRDAGTRVVIRTAEACLAGVQIRGEGMGTRVERMLGAEEVEIGDPEFDARFFLGGRTESTLAFLQEPMRRRLLALDEDVTFDVLGGELRFELPGRLTAERLGQLERALRMGLDVAQSWPHHQAVVDRLVWNALHDGQPAVRLKNLSTLAREFPGDALTGPTLRVACADPWPEIQLRAAMALGAGGRDALLALAEGGDDAYAARAVDALGEGLDGARALAILKAAAEAGRLEAARACLTWLGTRGDATAEPALVKMLTHAVGALRLAAAGALGHVGSIEAVVPLKDAALDDRGLASAARQAIAAIQSRVPGASPGQMALAEDEAGRLSVADGQPGQLSLPAAEPGRVTLHNVEAAGAAVIPKPPSRIR